MSKTRYILIAIIAIIGLSLAFLPVVTAYQVKIGPRCVANGSTTTLFGGYLTGQISSTAPVRVTIYNNEVPVYNVMSIYHNISQYLDKGGSVKVTVTNYQFQEVTVNYYLTVANLPILLS